MKFVIASAGLGNLMFQYAFFYALQKRCNDSCFFFVANKDKFDHRGYELDLIFNIKNYCKSNSIQVLYYKLLKAFKEIHLPGFWRLTTYDNLFMFFKKVIPKENFIYYPEIEKFDNSNAYYYGTWQSEKYFYNVRDEIQTIFDFNVNLLSEKTKRMCFLIDSNPNSVSIHIRRGDYMSEKYYDGLGRCCSMDYYIESINYIGNLYHDISFFVFSDDINYVKQHLDIKNATFVTFNKNEDSWQDMYLMSHCKHNIIANSSFSWWAAYLNKNEKKTVIAPKKWWWFFEYDDVVPESWIRI